MRFGKVKRARIEVAQSSRKNGDRVDELIREVDEVEGEVQKTIRRFSQKLKRYRANLTKRTEKPAPDIEVSKCSEGGE